MKPPSETHVVIAGAGLVGALLACQLGKRGYRVTLCERRPDPRAAGFIGGRFPHRLRPLEDELRQNQQAFRLANRRGQFKRSF